MLTLKPMLGAGDHGANLAPEAAVARTSGRLWCGKRCELALISVVERRDGTNLLRYVQWCSLVGTDIDCGEHCLGCLDDRSAAENEAPGPANERGVQPGKRAAAAKLSTRAR